MVWHKTHEWEKTHVVGKGWTVIGEARHKRSRLPMALLFCTDATKPWSVQYAGTGHYFDSRCEAEKWADERMQRP